MTNKSCKCLKDVLQILFANSYSEGEYLRFGNDDRLSNDHASSGTSLLRNGAAGHGESVQKAQTSDHFGPLPNGDGRCCRQTVQVQSVLGNVRSVRCAQF